MCELLNGVWQSRTFRPRQRDGAYDRPESPFRERLEARPESRFPAVGGRYHLYVSLACPWACRTLAVRALRGLEAQIGVTVVDPYMGSQGWFFSRYPGCEPDPNHGASYLHQLYTRARPDFSGLVTVPVLWDRQTETIVNNESSEIIRMLNEAFPAGSAAAPDLYPEPLRAEIDAINALVYDTVNNGVYRAGFATRQETYDAAVTALFATLDMLEQRLTHQRYLVGDTLTEADLRLFTTLVRFDAVYHGHFKCNLRRLVDYPQLWGYTRDLYQLPGIAETVNMDHIKRHYYTSHPGLNPSRIIPAGPALDFGAAHGRDRP